jgi:hypothetical protein
MYGAIMRLEGRLSLHKMTEAARWLLSSGALERGVETFDHDESRTRYKSEGYPLTRDTVETIHTELDIVKYRGGIVNAIGMSFCYRFSDPEDHVYFQMKFM